MISDCLLSYPKRNGMKNKIVIFLLAVFACSMVPVQAYATDYLLLELLIKCHKRQSDKLLNRNKYHSSILAEAILEQAGTDKYEAVCKDLSDRMGGVMAYVTFAADVANLGVLTQSVVKLEGEAIDLTFDCELDHPEVIDMGLIIHQEFARMTATIIKETAYLVTAGLNVTMATMEQRQQFTRFMYDQLYGMRARLRSFIAYASGVKRFGRIVSGPSYDRLLQSRESTVRIWDEVYNQVKGDILVDFKLDFNYE